MITLTIALAILLEKLFSPRWIIHGLMNVFFARGHWSGPAPLVSWLVSCGALLVIAWYLLRRLDVAPFARQLPRGIRLAKIGLWIYGVSFVLATVGELLNSIPYLGYANLAVFETIFGVGRVFVFAGLAVALIKELPAAQRNRTQAPNAGGGLSQPRRSASAEPSLLNRDLQ